MYLSENKVWAACTFQLGWIDTDGWCQPPWFYNLPLFYLPSNEKKILLIKFESWREQNSLCRGDVVSAVYMWILVCWPALPAVMGCTHQAAYSVWCPCNCKLGPHSSTPPLQLVNSQPVCCSSSSFLQPEPQTSSGTFGPLIRFPLPWISGWLTEQCWLIFYNFPTPHLFFHVTKVTRRWMTK